MTARWWCVSSEHAVDVLVFPRLRHTPSPRSAAPCATLTSTTPTTATMHTTHTLSNIVAPTTHTLTHTVHTHTFDIPMQTIPPHRRTTLPLHRPNMYTPTIYTPTIYTLTMHTHLTRTPHTPYPHTPSSPPVSTKSPCCACSSGVIASQHSTWNLTVLSTVAFILPTMSSPHLLHFTSASFAHV